MRLRDLGESRKYRARRKPGDILFSDLDAADVAEAVDRYLHGGFDQSDVRFGVALILGMDGVVGDPVRMTAEHERLIDHWLDENTVFAYTVHSEHRLSAPDYDLVGILNYVRSNWRGVRNAVDHNHR